MKARSKASQKILTRLQSNGDFNVIVFGDKVILDEGKSSPLSCMPVLTSPEFRGRELANMVSECFQLIFRWIYALDF